MCPVQTVLARNSGSELQGKNPNSHKTNPLYANTLPEWFPALGETGLVVRIPRIDCDRNAEWRLDWILGPVLLPGRTLRDETADTGDDDWV